MDSKQAIKNSLMIFSELYEMKLTKALAEIWIRTLSLYSPEEIDRATVNYVKNTDKGRFKPKPSDIIEMIEGDSESASLEAWTTAEEAMRKYGAYYSVTFSDKIILSVISDMGGWQEFCSMQESEVPFKRNEFSKRYKGKRATKNFEVKEPVLIGISDSYNIRLGFKKSPSVNMIGDKKICLENKKQYLLTSGENKNEN
ncbi:TPA: hypothetical protein JRS25_004117 [Escherichia coli]|nr:hypothetical protein [Escherichia coli]